MVQVRLTFRRAPFRWSNCWATNSVVNDGRCKECDVGNSPDPLGPTEWDIQKAYADCAVYSGASFQGAELAPGGGCKLNIDLRPDLLIIQKTRYGGILGNQTRLAKFLSCHQSSRISAAPVVAILSSLQRTLDAIRVLSSLRLWSNIAAVPATAPLQESDQLDML